MATCIHQSRLAVAWIGFLACGSTASPEALEPVRISADGRGFILATSGQPFRVWGVNYDHDASGDNGRLLEDYWTDEWEIHQGLQIR